MLTQQADGRAERSGRELGGSRPAAQDHDVTALHLQVHHSLTCSIRSVSVHCSMALVCRHRCVSFNSRRLCVGDYALDSDVVVVYLT